VVFADAPVGGVAFDAAHVPERAVIGRFFARRKAWTCSHDPGQLNLARENFAW
jgi:hypothetical protein